MNMFSNNRKNGFTLVEMVVTISIFTIISLVIIVRNARFDNETLLHNLAYDIALSMRQAQQFGVNVRVVGDDFDRPHGIHFDKNANTYHMFADSDDDGIYDEETELLETFTIGRGATIGVLCDLTSTPNCDLNRLDIVFRRPDPDAVINNGNVGSASIELVSARGDGRRNIIVESTGQMSIQKPEE